MSAERDPRGSGVAAPASRYKGTPSRARLVEVARFFTKLGFVGFGGPLVHIAMMEDELVREQAKKAYRSLLDNFFGSVTVFECCPGASPDGEPVPFSIPLNELTADALYRTDATGFRRLVPGAPILVLELLLDWGYSYQPATPPNFDNGVVSVNEG